MNSNSDSDFEKDNQRPSRSDSETRAKKPKLKRDWGAPKFLNSTEDFVMFKDNLEGAFKNIRYNNVTCDICPINPFFHNMRRGYFKCDNADCECEVDEPDCFCLKCAAELKSEQCSVTSRTRVQMCGEHLDSCSKVKKNGLHIKLKKAVIKIKKQHKGPNFGPSKVRDALLDNGFKRDELPPVKKDENFLSHKRNFATNSSKMQQKIITALFMAVLCEWMGL